MKSVDPDIVETSTWCDCVCVFRYCSLLFCIVYSQLGKCVDQGLRLSLGMWAICPCKGDGGILANDGITHIGSG